MDKTRSEEEFNIGVMARSGQATDHPGGGDGDVLYR